MLKSLIHSCNSISFDTCILILGAQSLQCSFHAKNRSVLKRLRKRSEINDKTQDHTSIRLYRYMTHFYS